MPRIEPRRVPANGVVPALDSPLVSNLQLAFGSTDRRSLELDALIDRLDCLAWSEVARTV